MNLRLSKVAKEKLAPHGNLLAAIGTAFGSAHQFFIGNPRMGTDLANISVLTFKTWLLPYVEEGKNINYMSILWNLLDSILMEGATQVWGVPTYRGTHIITGIESLANITELYLKRNSGIVTTKKTENPAKTNYFNPQNELSKSSFGPLINRLYI